MTSLLVACGEDADLDPQADAGPLTADATVVDGAASDASDMADEGPLDANPPTADAGSPDAGGLSGPTTLHAFITNGTPTAWCATLWGTGVEDELHTRTACTGEAPNTFEVPTPTDQHIETIFDPEDLTPFFTVHRREQAYAGFRVLTGHVLLREEAGWRLDREVRGFRFGAQPPPPEAVLWHWQDPGQIAAVARRALATGGLNELSHEPAQGFTQPFRFVVDGPNTVRIDGSDYTITLDDEGLLLAVDAPSLGFQVERIDALPAGRRLPEDGLPTQGEVEDLPPLTPLPEIEERLVEVISDDGTALDCLVYQPEEPGPLAALIANGSGPGTRDQLRALPDHLYLELGRRLAAVGLTIMECNKRLAPSAPDGGFVEPLSSLQQQDAVAALRWLADEPEVERLVVIGQSLGGWQGPRIIAAAEAEMLPTSGLVMLAACGAPMYDLMLAQLEHTQRLSGVPERTIRRQRTDIESQWARVVEGTWPANQRFLGQSLAWWEDAMDIDPVADLAGLDIPLLVVHGDEDTVCTAEIADATEAGLEGRPETTMLRFPESDHLIKRVRSPGVRASFGVPRWMRPEAYEALETWVLSR